MPPEAQQVETTLLDYTINAPMTFLQKWKYKRKMSRVKMFIHRINKLHEEVGIMSKYQLKDGKLIRTESVIRQQTPAAQQYPPPQEQRQAYQPRQEQPLPDFPLDDDAMLSDIVPPAPPEPRQRQHVATQPDPRVIHVIITLVHGAQLDIPIVEPELPGFIEELNTAIDARSVYQVQNMFIATRHITMYQLSTR